MRALEKLFELSQNLIDLTDPSVMTVERVGKMISSSLGFDLYYSTERVDKKVMKALFDYAEEKQVMKNMQAMQNGEVVNFLLSLPSENRPALHTATRDFFEDRNLSERAQMARDKAKVEIEKLKAFEKVMQDYDHIVQIGIGGSELGPKALYDALISFHKKNKKVDFISNIDPDNLTYIIENCDLEKTLFVSVSKSGTTLETLTNEKIIRSLLEKQGILPQKHIVAVTQQESSMDNKDLYLECFYIWDYIGGRFSASSMVGGVVLTFGLGFDFYWEILRGASAMDQVAFSSSEKENLPLLAALFSFWNVSFCKIPTIAVICYSHYLSSFVSHLQQLEMESHGKNITKEGKEIPFPASPILWGGIGSNVQHSFFQLLHQARCHTAVEFIGFQKPQFEKDYIIDKTLSQEKLNSNLFAQALALAIGQKNENPNHFFPGNRPSHILLSASLTPYVMGALLSFYEHKIAFEGFLWDINSFDQEGVELGKKLASAFLRVYRKEKEDISPLIKAFVDASKQ